VRLRDTSALRVDERRDGQDDGARRIAREPVAADLRARPGDQAGRALEVFVLERDQGELCQAQRLDLGRGHRGEACGRLEMVPRRRGVTAELL
jgi:hypothetical protein